jgi:hypothetical protein
LPSPALIVSIAFTLPLAVIAQPCTSEWSDRFTYEGFAGPVTSMVVFDDGAGPLLIAAGSFTSVGGVQARHIAFWNGTAWAEFAGGLPGPVNALTIFDEDGAGPIPPALAAAGNNFGTIVAPCGVAVYRQGQWHMIPGMGSALAIHGLSEPGPGGTSLYAGRQGVFTLIGGTLVQVGSSDGTINALAVHDDGAGPALYAGGNYTSMAGIAARRIARWDGGGWSALGSGVSNGLSNGPVWALASFDPDGPGPSPAVLVVGGDFTHGGSWESPHAALWHAGGWVAMPGLSGSVMGFHTVDFGPPLNRQLVALNTRPANNVERGGVVRWTGSEWIGFGAGMNAFVFTAAIHDFGGGGAQLVVGGSFTRTNVEPSQLGGVARWDIGPEMWAPVGHAEISGLNDFVEHAVMHDEDGDGPLEPYLLVGGRFTRAGGIEARGLARWSEGEGGGGPGSGWAPFGQGGTHPQVWGLGTYKQDPSSAAPADLFLGTRLPVEGSRASRWDGQAWRGIGELVLIPSVFEGFAAPGGPRMLYAGGQPLNSLLNVPLVEHWDGQQWTPAGFVYGAAVHALKVFDPDGTGPEPASLIAAGNFQVVGLTPRNIARWDGLEWRPMGPGIQSTVYALEVFDEDGAGPMPAALFAGGAFTAIGAVQMPGIARWDGAAWSGVGPQPGQPSLLTVRQLAVFEVEGVHGPSLYVGGSFITSVQTPTPQQLRRIARWDGTAWHGLGDTVDGAINRMVVVDRGAQGSAGLYILGNFRNAGGIPSLNIARWGCPAAPPCYANCDQSTVPPVLNVDDFTCFINQYAQAQSLPPAQQVAHYANCDNSTIAPVLNVDDFTCFINQFALGCP